MSHPDTAILCHTVCSRGCRQRSSTPPMLVPVDLSVCALYHIVVSLDYVSCWLLGLGGARLTR